MDIEKLIEQLRTESLYADKASLEIMDLCMDAATALSTHQAENEKLRADVVRLNDILASYQNVLVPELRVENENLKERIEDTRLEWYAKGFGEVIAEVKRVRAELEQVKQERDAAVKDLNEFLSLDELCPIQCKWCKWENTNCDGKIPEWRGPQKEDERSRGRIKAKLN